MSLLVLDSVSKKIQDKVLLQNINFEAHKGDVVTILGRSGAGKSTLLRCINLLEKPTQGSIKIKDFKINASDFDKKGKINKNKKQELRDLRIICPMVFQSSALWTHMSVLENIIEAPINVKNIPKNEAIQKAKDILNDVGLLHKANEHPANLSGGEAQRVGIARALAVDPEIILFDEPTSALDPSLVNEVVNVMIKLAHKGITMLVVTHEIKFAKEVSNKCIILSQGSILEKGYTSDILNKNETELIKVFEINDNSNK